ncbi:hypothetical protein GCM10028806_33490 [Spirosoma terrae]|uniref:DUF5983 domain-containing protein n=1 Tax=Spirosoma terrae TaxID=1968276 RepID=A0A6L9L593_9BACT|nr:hypothetical protein [Spirosoma terrae]NDU95664.1 hypothetical protein [Spirosoma terrae]
MSVIYSKTQTGVFLEVSTAHLKKQDAQWLDLQAIAGEFSNWTVAKYPEGYFVVVPAELNDQAEINSGTFEHVPIRVLQHWLMADKAGCRIIRYDRDVEPYPDLDRYEW